MAVDLILIPSKIARLVVCIETNDHSGYCSGAENEYESNTVTTFVPLPSEFAHLKVGDDIELDGYDWSDAIKPLDPKQIYCHGSGYCSVGDAFSSRGLGRHDKRLTVVSATVAKAKAKANTRVEELCKSEDTTPSSTKSR